MKNNYNEFDKITIYAKKTKTEEIINHYKVFGWEVVEEVENNRYEDIVDLTFCRPHKIENKDELQLLQIYMEERLNEIAKIERNKNAKTTSFGLCFGVVSFALIVVGILAILKVLDIFGLIGGVTITVLGVILMIITTIVLPRTYKKEKIDYDAKHIQLEEEVNQILERVRKGGQSNEKN